MAWAFIAIGVGLVGLTAWQQMRGETDSVFLLDWDWLEFDLSRDENPTLFWAALAAQVCAGIGAIVTGLTKL